MGSGADCASYDAVLQKIVIASYVIIGPIGTAFPTLRNYNSSVVTTGFIKSGSLSCRRIEEDRIIVEAVQEHEQHGTAVGKVEQCIR